MFLSCFWVCGILDFGVFVWLEGGCGFGIFCFVTLCVWFVMICGSYGFGVDAVLDLLALT